MADNRGALDELTRHSARGLFHWVFHYALHDIAYTQRMGVIPDGPGALDDLPFRDTMMRAYHRADLPQGLKALCHRKLGMDMADFEDVVMPYAEDAMRGWLTAIADPYGLGVGHEAYGRPIKKPSKRNPEPVAGHKNPWGQSLAPRQQPVDRKATRILGDRYGHWSKGTKKRPAVWVEGNPAVDMFARWGLVPEADRQWIEGQMGTGMGMGRPPGKGIEHLPMDKLARYAGRDADGTLRMHHWLEDHPVTR